MFQRIKHEIENIPCPSAHPINDVKCVQWIGHRFDKHADMRVHMWWPSLDTPIEECLFWTRKGPITYDQLLDLIEDKIVEEEFKRIAKETRTRKH